MDQKRRTMLTAIRPAIILPFFLSRAKLHIPSRRIPPVLKRAGCAWFIWGGVRLVYLSALLPLQQGGEGG